MISTFGHLSTAGMQQAAAVTAIFLFNTAVRDQMLPRNPLPLPAARE